MVSRELCGAAGESASVPCGIVFNECPDDDWIRMAITFGFDLVMPADATAWSESYVERVSFLTRLAHARGVAVEAELGELPAGLAGHGSGEGSLTDPEQAARFIAATGIDILAVSVGHVHAKIDGTQGLDLERLAEIHRQVEIPLVLHGGTGIDAASLRAAIRRGVVKVNYGTYLKQRYLRAVSGAIDRERAPTRIGSSAWEGRTICWLPAALRSAMPCSSGSNFLAVAGRRLAFDLVCSWTA